MSSPRCKVSGFSGTSGPGFPYVAGSTRTVSSNSASGRSGSADSNTSGSVCSWVVLRNFLFLLSSRQPTSTMYERGATCSKHVPSCHRLSCWDGDGLIHTVSGICNSGNFFEPRS